MVNNWLESAIISSDQMNETDAALDTLYDCVDDLMLVGDFKRVDELIAYFASTIDTYSLCLAIGVLTITLPARSHLSERPAYLELAKQKAIKEGEDIDSLFFGLNNFPEPPLTNRVLPAIMEKTHETV